MIDYKDHPIFDDYDYVVGVDPGSITGVSVFDRFGMKDVSYHLALPSKDGIEKRNLGMAYSVLNEIAEVTTSEMAAFLIKVGRPTPFPPRILFVIENNVIYPQRKNKAGKVIGGGFAAALTQREMIGVIAAYAHKYGADVIRVSPASAKKALTGSGKAKKPDMVLAAKDVCTATIDGLGSVAKREAVADSMGIAMAGMVKYINDKEK